MIFSILATIVFTGCVENGKTLEPRTNSKVVVQSQSSIEANATKTINVLDANSTETVETGIIDFSFLNLTDETKNTLSGVAIILIGIIILL